MAIAGSGDSKVVPVPFPSTLHSYEVRLHRIARLHDVGLYRYPELLIDLHTAVSERREMVFQGWELAKESSKEGHEEKPLYRLRQFGKSTEDLKDSDLEPLGPSQSSRHRQDQAKRYKGLGCSISKPSREGRSGEEEMGRIFVREDSRPVTDQWVYVFQSSDPEGREQVYLMAELEFAKDQQDSSGQSKLKYGDRGEFRRMPIEKPMNLGDIVARIQSSRPPSGQSQVRPDEPLREIPKTTRRESILNLMVETIHPRKGWVQAYYFFYLARWQLPWDGVLKVATDLQNRAVRLGDFFYTDVNPNRQAAPEGFKPLLPRQTQQKEEMKEIVRRLPVGTYILHLLDPFEEAIARAKEYRGALDQIARLIPDRSAEPEYAYAKTIELLLTKVAPKHRAIVEKKLNGYLYPCGKDTVGRAWAITGILLEQLIDWIGQPWRREGNEAYRDPFISFEYRDVSDSYRTLSRHLDPYLPQVNDQDWSNSFSEAVECYYDAPEEEVRRRVADVVNAATIDLPKMPQGQAWLYENLAAIMPQLRDLAKRKDTDEAVRKDLEAIFLNTGPALATKKGPKAEPVDALKMLDGKSLVPTRKGLGERAYGGLEMFFQLNKSWGEKDATYAMKAAHFIYASAWVRLEGERVVEALNRLLNGRFNLKVDLGIRMQDDNPVAGRKSVGKSPFKAAQLGISMIGDTLGLIEAVDNLRKHAKNPRKWAEASAAFTLAVASYKETKEMVEVLAGVRAVGVKTTGLSGMVIYARTVGLVTGTLDIFKSHDSGEALGRSVKLMGTIVGMVGFTGGTAIVMAAVALAIQFVGDWIAFKFSGLTQFLRGCRFADHEGTDTLLLQSSPTGADIMSVSSAGDASDRRKRGELYQDIWKRGLSAEQQALEELIYECKQGLFIDEKELLQDSKPAPYTKGEPVTLVLTPYYWHCYTTDYELVADVKVHLDVTEVGTGTLPRRLGTANGVYCSSETSVRTLPEDLVLMDDEAKEDHLFRIPVGRVPAAPDVIRFPTLGTLEGNMQGRLSVTGTLTLSLKQGVSGQPSKIVTPVNLQTILRKRFARRDSPL